MLKRDQSRGLQTSVFVLCLHEIRFKQYDYLKTTNTINSNTFVENLFALNYHSFINSHTEFEQGFVLPKKPVMSNPHKTTYFAETECWSISLIVLI